MNVYDFDKTIYAGDSTIDFFLYCLKKHPVIFCKIPKQVRGFVNYKRGKIHKTEFKELFFCFLSKIPQVNIDVLEFWHVHEKKICEWYLQQQKADDLVISASPEFLLRPICEKMGIRYLIASKVDINTGKFLSENCYGEEKLYRFRQEFPMESIEQFYSDSNSDSPLAQIAKEAYKVKKGSITCWKEERKVDESDEKD